MKKQWERYIKYNWFRLHYGEYTGNVNNFIKFGKDIRRNIMKSKVATEKQQQVGSEVIIFRTAACCTHHNKSEAIASTTSPIIMRWVAMHRRIINTIKSTQLVLFYKDHYIVIDDLVTDYTTIKEHLTNLLNECCDCWVTIRGELETNPVAGPQPITIDKSKQRSKPSRLPTSKRKRDGRTI